jgi:hypothetical protein
MAQTMGKIFLGSLHQVQKEAARGQKQSGYRQGKDNTDGNGTPKEPTDPGPIHGRKGLANGEGETGHDAKSKATDEIVDLAGGTYAAQGIRADELAHKDIIVETGCLHQQRTGAHGDQEFGNHRKRFSDSELIGHKNRPPLLVLPTSILFFIAKARGEYCTKTTDAFCTTCGKYGLPRTEKCSVGYFCLTCKNPYEIIILIKE